jgi:AcrR family transcriptional regulator
MLGVPSRPPRTTHSLSTRGKLLEAAECLFAQHGFEGTTLRALTRIAGANLAAVNYHFGSKEGLIEEVVRTYLEPLNRERERLLDEAQQRHGGAPVPIRELVQMFLAPAVRALAERHRGLPSLLSRLHHEPHPTVEAMIVAVSQPTVRRYGEAVQRALPHLDASRVLLRGHFMMGAMLFALGQGRALMRGLLPPGAPEPSAESLLDELVSFCVAGFEAHG